MTRKIILSGGGTGGHIYPAVAVAEALKRRFGDGVEILFVGAEGKMEMEKVPALGYRIVGLPIAGLQRRLDWRNLAVPFKAVKSIRMAKRIIRDFGADAVVGFGGYASAPVLWAAQRMGVPTVIQEQNSYAGVTNKILAKGARRICTAYEGMERFFPAAKIVLTGNPLRGRFSKEGADRAEALEYYGLTPDLPVILVVGGSLGTRSLNEMMKAWIVGTDGKAPVQVIWQTGKYYEREMQAFLAAHPAAHVWQGAFIDRMDYAYAAADLVVSRSGAGNRSVAAGGGLQLPALLQQIVQPLSILGPQGVAVVRQVADQLFQLGGEEVLIVQKQLCPHVLIQTGHPGHILKAAGGEAAALLRLGRLDVGARDDVRELRGKGNDAVMLLGIGEGQARKADIEEKRLERFKQLIRALVRRKDHGRAHIQAVRRGGKAAALAARHRMSADVGEAVLLGDRREFAHHRALHTAQVHKDRAPADSLRVLLHPFYRRSGTDGDQHKVAIRQIFRRQRRVDGAAHTRHHHGLLIEVAAEHGVRGACLDALGHRASDEAHADNADCHSLTPLSS